MRILLSGLLLLALGGCGNKPPEAPLLFGDSRLRPGDTCRLRVWAVDPGGESLQYRLDWDDGSETDWSDWKPSGTEVWFRHAYRDTGVFEVTGRARNPKRESASSDPFFVRVYEYGPNRPTGPRLAADTVLVGDSLGATAMAMHPLDEPVAFQFNWGDTLGGWSNQVPAGEWLPPVRHAYSVPGSYAVRVQARDVSGYLSEWSAPVTVLVLESVSLGR